MGAATEEQNIPIRPKKAPPSLGKERGRIQKRKRLLKRKNWRSCQKNAAQHHQEGKESKRCHERETSLKKKGIELTERKTASKKDQKKKNQVRKD